jgi:hypothetical protein
MPIGLDLYQGMALELAEKVLFATEKRYLSG